MEATTLAPAMPRPRRLTTPQVVSLESHIEHAFNELDLINPTRFDRHTDRVALALLADPAGPGRYDPLGELLPGVVPLGQLRAVALSLRACRRNTDGGMIRRAAPATYAPVVDLPGSGQVRWAPERVSNLRDEGPRMALPPAYRRLAVLLIQGLLDRAADELLDAPQLPALKWAFAPAAPPPPAPGFDEADWMDLQEPIEGLCTWPHELLARDHDEPGDPAPLPLRILADCREVRGEIIRNPAAVAIEARGHDVYGGRTAQEFRRAVVGVHGAQMERAALEAAAQAAGMDEPDGEGRHREILTEIQVVMAALGAGDAVDFDDPVARMAADELMAQPTCLVPAPYAPTVQVVRVLGGVPTPAACDFSTPVVHLDLSELGAQGSWYAPVRPRQSRRGGRPDRPSRRRS